MFLTQGLIKFHNVEVGIGSMLTLNSLALPLGPLGNLKPATCNLEPWNI